METSGKKFGYARVSSREQNLNRQLDALRGVGIAERDIFCDKMSGKNFDRPNYLALRDHVLRRGDELFLISLDRLGRNKVETLDELRKFEAAGVYVRILDIPTTLIEIDGQNDWVLQMVNNIIIEVYASIAQQERETIRKRQREGIDAAQARGQHLGRPRVQLPENFGQIAARWKAGDITAVDAMRLSGLKPKTFYRRVRELGDV